MDIEGIGTNNSTDLLVKELLETNWKYWIKSPTPIDQIGVRVGQIQNILIQRPELEVCKSLVGNLEIQRTLVIQNISGKVFEQSPLKIKNKFVHGLLERMELVGISDKLMTQEEAVLFLTSTNIVGDTLLEGLLKGPYKRPRGGYCFPAFSKKRLRVIIPNNRADNLYRLGPNLYSYFYNYYDDLY
ncbi:MAG: hypothetical protein Q7R97_02000 [Candidatus Daviesbacteria bacterium]|nr:hypothetical protein [Candidatus Daviesbacteria bacterium]